MSLTLTLSRHGLMSGLDLWYNAKNNVECVMAHDSFQPLIYYYLTRLKEWGMSFNVCRICGSDFLARRHYNFCGDACRRKQISETQKQFMERRTEASPNEYLYNTTYDYWYNRVRKLKWANAPESVISKATAAFEAYRLEGVRLKSELREDAFKAWIQEQMEIVDALAIK